jgi:hypothetical protein
MRILGAHPNLVRCGDMFAWNDDSFVEPVGYVEGAQLLEWLLDKRSERTLTWDEKARIIRGAWRRGWRTPTSTASSTATSAPTTSSSPRTES